MIDYNTSVVPGVRRVDGWLPGLVLFNVYSCVQLSE